VSNELKSSDTGFQEREITHTAPTITVTRRLWRARGAKIYLLIVAAALAFVALNIHEAIIWINSPETGLTFMKHGPVKHADQRWPGVERGDEVVEINGAHQRGSAPSAFGQLADDPRGPAWVAHHPVRT
jgi:hypothetical protein